MEELICLKEVGLESLPLPFKVTVGGTTDVIDVMLANKQKNTGILYKLL